MQRLEVTGAVRPIYGSLGVKRLTACFFYVTCICEPNEKFPAAILNVVSKNLILTEICFTNSA